MKAPVKEKYKYRLRKGDPVIVTVGKSKGETGKVERIDGKSGRVFVSGTNIYKKHQKPGQVSEEGGIIDKSMPLDLSNVAYVDPESKKATKIGYKIDDGKKVRFAKASGTILS